MAAVRPESFDDPSSRALAFLERLEFGYFPGQRIPGTNQHSLTGDTEQIDAILSGIKESARNTATQLGSTSIEGTGGQFRLAL